MFTTSMQYSQAMLHIPVGMCCFQYHASMSKCVSDGQIYYYVCFACCFVTGGIL